MGLHTLDTDNNLVSLAEARQYCGIDSDVAEITDVRCVADVAGSLGGKYFLLYSPSVAYYVWIDVADGSTDPAPAGKTGIEADISAGATAATVATAVATAVDAHAAFAAAASGSNCRITAADTGTCTAATAGDSGFTISVRVSGKYSDPTYDDVLTLLVNEASWYLNAETGRELKSRSQTEYYDHFTDSVLFLNHPPVSTVVIYQDPDYAWGATTVVTDTDYVVYTDTGKIEMVGDAFLRDPRSIKVTYTGGYATIPYDLEGACLELIAQRFWEFAHQNQAVESRSGKEAAVYDKKRLEKVTAAIQRYRRVVIA